MKSYASIDRLERTFAVCEVELVSIDKSVTTDFASKKTKMMEIPIAELWATVRWVEEGDVIVVKHDGVNVTKVCYKSEAEKQRRIDLIKAIMKR